ncbi:MAG: hypothetical protein ACI8XU_001320 [Kiritimatiellia bacterium]|jgi:uncharacterized protein (TIGR00251 family)
MYYRWEKDALYLNCSVQPKANEDRIVGVVGEHLKIRISAAPLNGKANKQLIRFLAKLFHTKQTAITLVSGLTGRHKRLCIKKPLSIPPGLEIPKGTLS